MDESGSYFTDHDVHRVLRSMGVTRIKGEWFECSVSEVQAAIQQLHDGTPANRNPKQIFQMRPEQQQAVEQTSRYLRRNSLKKTGRAPHYLWSAKMRFGKSYTSYQLAKAMGFKRILVLTFKPAVEDAWKSDLENHKDFTDWQFVPSGEDIDGINRKNPYVRFASFQDVLSTDADNKTKARLQSLHDEDWDLVIIDEYHFGAWNEASKDFYASEPDELPDQAAFSEEIFPLKVKNYLYLSGTPFQALARGEFTEDQIFSWTYADEQGAKEGWDQKQGPSPYEAMPQMIMMAYQMPDSLRRIAEQGDKNEFDLNAFFATEKVGKGKSAQSKFVNEPDVQKWLDLIRGQLPDFDSRLSGDTKERPALPFDDIRLLQSLRHTFWYLPTVSSCRAMSDLLGQPQNSFYDDYEVVVAAGSQAGIGIEALPPVRKAISRNGLKTKSITLSCGKLTTGVTVPEWSGIFMLRNIESPESYFQAAFRVQSSWTSKRIDAKRGEVAQNLKPLCYVFDFAPSRALNLVVDYATSLSSDAEKSNAERITDYLQFLPVICYDGATFEQLDAAKVQDYAATSITNTALARRWQSARLVDLSSEALGRLMANTDLVGRLEKFEGFRNLRSDITKTISAERTVKQTRSTLKKGDKKQKAKLTQAEKELNKRRKELRDNLLKFASRIPIFMYITDYREEKLQDVIRCQDPKLFSRVTNLDVADFEQLCNLGIFNSATMNSAVFAFRRFEEPSLHYASPEYSPEDDDKKLVGGFDSQAIARDVRTGQV